MTAPAIFVAVYCALLVNRYMQSHNRRERVAGVALAVAWTATYAAQVLLGAVR